MDWTSIGQTVATAIGTLVIAGGGIGAIAFGMFKWLGEKWLSNKFEKEMHEYRHEQQKELENLRFRINSLMDRTIKLHQKEFDVIPEAWGLAVTAYSGARGLLSAYQEYPDVDRMGDEELDEFLSRTPLHPWQKAELKKAQRKVNYYRTAILWHQFNKVYKQYEELNACVWKNGIFMPPEIKRRFNELKDLIWDALTEYRINEQDNVRPRLRDDAAALGKKGEPLLAEIEDEVSKRLWSIGEKRSEPTKEIAASSET